MNVDNNFFSNILDERIYHYDEKDSLFTLNQNQYNMPDCINFSPNIDIQEKNNDNFSFKFNDNPIQFENNLFTKDIFNKDFSQSPLFPTFNQGDEDDSSKQQMNVINNISNISNSSSTKDKSQLKNNINSNNSNSNITNNNAVSECDENSGNNDEINKFLTNKRKPRKHLEDLGLDPQVIKGKKFLKIGDKVILSKNHLITDDDKKEIRAMRNRISAQKSRDKKKEEFNNLKEQIKYLTEELNKKILIINRYNELVCPRCKNKIAEIDSKVLEDYDKNSNKIYLNNNENANEELVLEENDSFSNKKNSFVGKISGILLGVVCLIGIAFCVFQSDQIVKTSNLSQKLISSDYSPGTLRHLNVDGVCPTVNNNGNEGNESTNEVIEAKENVPLSVDYFNRNNFLQMCHDKFTWEIYSKLKEKREKKKGNFLRKRNLRDDQIQDNSVCIDVDKIIHHNYTIINDSSLINNLPIDASNIILNEDLSNKIITVFVKDYKALKKFSNGRSLPLQEQIENEAKNSEDGCVYLQMIIPREIIKSSLDRNGSFSEYENEFFEIRCKIFAYNNYYES